MIVLLICFCSHIIHIDGNQDEVTQNIKLTSAYFLELPVCTKFPSQSEIQGHQSSKQATCYLSR